MAPPSHARVTVHFLTARAARTLGVQAIGLRHSLQIQHDLLVASVYFHLLKTKPTLGPRWISDLTYHALFPDRRKSPDAVILSRHGKGPLLAIEVVGRYDYTRLLRFHRWCATQHPSLPYELW